MREVGRRSIRKKHAVTPCDPLSYPSKKIVEFRVVRQFFECGETDSRTVAFFLFDGFIPIPAMQGQLAHGVFRFIGKRIQIPRFFQIVARKAFDSIPVSAAIFAGNERGGAMLA